MPDADLGYVLLTLAVAVVAGGAAALRWVRIARLIEDTPTSRIRSAAQGYVELTGRALPLPGPRTLAPLTQRPCVWWRYTISQQTERGSGSHRSRSWQTVASATSDVPFLLDDDTGRCLVQPLGAEVVTTESTTWYGATSWPVKPGGSRPWLTGSREYRYHEERIYEHELVYGLGDFNSVAANAAPDLAAAQSALLAEWKRDQPELLRRFDADGDGRIDLDEWERAREAARQTVREQRAEQAPRETLHVLCRPGPGQLFLLAALPPGDLVQRYRRKALVSFALFGVAVCALGWLIQDAFG